MPRVAADGAASPFLKWAGGKGQLLPELLARVPPKLGTYHEPFLGSGAFFFALRAAGRLKRARLCDANEELINAFCAVRDDVEAVIGHLRRHTADAEHFYEVRALDPANLSPSERAARLIYLNRTCFNGLYRVNTRGRFNVPYGRYQNPRICDPPRLEAASAALRGVELVCEPFGDALTRAKRGDFVYLDPPYVPVSKSASFTAYSAGGFGPVEQKRLARDAMALAERGVHVLLSNADVPVVHDLYADCLRERVQAARAINSKGDRRGKVSELLIRPRVLGRSSARQGAGTRAGAARDDRTLSLPPGPR
jgi:DNA adenine methylase